MRVTQLPINNICPEQDVKVSERNTMETSEQRNARIQELNKAFITECRKCGLELSDNAICTISANYVRVFVLAENGSLIFNSEVSFYVENNAVSMSVASSSDFTPEHQGSFWKTIHAANFLQQWQVTIEIVQSFTERYSQLIKSFKMD